LELEPPFPGPDSSRRSTFKSIKTPAASTPFALFSELNKHMHDPSCMEKHSEEDDKAMKLRKTLKSANTKENQKAQL